MRKKYQDLLQKLQTPYKYNQPVLTGSGVPGSFDEQSVDRPFVFYHQNQWYMMYTGFDGIGYQTALAVSQDLLHWTFLATILKRNQSGNHWDRVGCAGTWLIKENDLLTSVPTLKKIDGKYWMIYHSYPDTGYETGPAEIGLAWCKNEDLLQWHCLSSPVLSWKDGSDWEKGGLYKACILYHNCKYYMFYNAKTTDERWIEQTGLATSTDLLHWTRCESNPVLPVSSIRNWDCKFVSDPYIVRDHDTWINFFFGYDYEHAQEGVAFSEDLIHWEKNPVPLLSCGSSELQELDSIHAHKASIVFYNGKLYHFYCAVRPYKKDDPACNNGEFRCITVACSEKFDLPSTT
mgnify:FL=1